MPTYIPTPPPLAEKLTASELEFLVQAGSWTTCGPVDKSACKTMRGLNLIERAAIPGASPCGGPAWGWGTTYEGRRLRTALFIFSHEVQLSMSPLQRYMMGLEPRSPNFIAWHGGGQRRSLNALVRRKLVHLNLCSGEPRYWFTALGQWVARRMARHQDASPAIVIGTDAREITVTSCRECPFLTNDEGDGVPRCQLGPVSGRGPRLFIPPLGGRPDGCPLPQLRVITTETKGP